MARNPNRVSRLADQIQRDLAESIRRELKDPRVRLVTVTAVHLSPDLARAQVFVTSLEDASASQELVMALQRAAGFLRAGLGRSLKLRSAPELRFVYDESIERGVRLSKLIDDAVKSDDEHDRT